MTLQDIHRRRGKMHQRNIIQMYNMIITKGETSIAIAHTSAQPCGNSCCSEVTLEILKSDLDMLIFGLFVVNWDPLGKQLESHEWLYR